MAEHRTAMERANTPQTLETIAALRFFASLLVVTFHAWLPFMRPWGSFEGIPIPMPLTLAFVAVTWFFVVSGVVLSWSWTPEASIRTQWRRRVARIFPVHWLMLIALVAMSQLHPALRAPDQESAAVFLRQATLTQSWPPHSKLEVFNAPTWTLSIEIFCYLLFPLIVPWVARLRLNHLLLAASAAALTYALVVLAVQPPHAAPDFLRYDTFFPPLQFLKFFVGVCIGCALRRGWRPRLQLRYSLGAMLIIASLAGSISSLPEQLADGRSFDMMDLALLPLTFAVVISAAGRDLRPSRPKTSPFLVNRGLETYSLYVLHYPALVLVVLVRLLTGTLAGPAPGFGLLLVYVFGCVAAAALLERGFVRPVERWIRGPSPVPVRRQLATDDIHPVEVLSQQGAV